MNPDCLSNKYAITNGKNVTSDFFQGFFSHPGSARPLLADLIAINVHPCTPVQVTVTELQRVSWTTDPTTSVFNLRERVLVLPRTGL